MNRLKELFSARRGVLLAAAGLALLLPAAAAEAQVNLRLATVAPRGSAWYLILDKMAAAIGRDTGGEVRIRIIAGGAAGDESDMIRKMRLGQVQIAAMSNVGLAELDPSAWTLSIPMVFRDYPEWDHVREAMNPAIEEALQGHGFRTLAWADVGWLHFFASEPVNSLDDLKNLKLAGAASDPTVLDLLRWAGFDPVQINTVELVSGFQTGLVEAAPLPVILAEGSQLYRSAEFMNDLPWAPMQGAIIIHDQGWDRLDRLPAGGGRPPEPGSGAGIPRDKPRAGAEVAGSDEVPRTSGDRSLRGIRSRLDRGGRGDVPDDPRTPGPCPGVRPGNPAPRRVPGGP